MSRVATFLRPLEALPWPRLLPSTEHLPAQNQKPFLRMDSVSQADFPPPRDDPACGITRRGAVPTWPYTVPLLARGRTELKAPSPVFSLACFKQPVLSIL